MNKFADLQIRRFVDSRLIILLILLLAAGLRFYRLDAQSFWNDEGNSARIAERGIQLILEGAAGDIHPPLYYLGLHFWRTLVGGSEFALRALSAVGGVGLVLLVYLLGDHLFGRTTGLAAAFFAAVNPFQVYYSQELRAYIWLALLGTAAVYAAVRWFESRTQGESASPSASGKWSAGYILAVTAGLYTHYLFPFALLGVNLAALVYLIRNRALKTLGHWLLLHLIVVLLYLPWAPIAYRQLTGWPSSAGGITLTSSLLELFRLLGLGLTIETGTASIALLGLGFLLLLALLPQAGRRPQAFPGTLTLLLWLLVPVVLILVLGLYKDAFLKFMLVVSPPFCLLLGRGVGSRLRLDSGRTVLFPMALSLGLVLSFSYESLQNLYFDPTYARADYRGMAEAVQAAARPGDGVILDAANQWEVFTYYYPHVERVYPIPRQRPVREPEVVAELEGIAAKHDRLFAIFWAEVESDPQRVVERWLDAHTYQAADDWWGDVRLVTYAVPAAPADELEVPLDARLGDAIILRGYTLLEERLAPGDIVQITLFWEAQTPIKERYKVFLHLLDSEGRMGAQRDSEPGGGLALTSTWEPNVRQIDNHGILVPLDAAAGAYQLIAGLYPLEDPLTRLPATLDGEAVGDTIPLASITVAEP